MLVNNRKRVVIAMIVAVACSGSFANGGWVIERDDRGESPLLKDRKMIGLSPEQQQQQTLAAAYARALEQEKAKIRQHWPMAEVSNQSRWVAYSSDYQTRKTVDFEHNRIEISLSGAYDNGRLDFVATQKAVQQELEATLSTTVAGALDQDAVHQALKQAQIHLSQGVSDAAEVAAELVLSELFLAKNPSPNDIHRVAAALMQNASIRYQSLNAGLASIPIKTGKKLTYVIPLPDNRIRKKVQEYQGDVRDNAKRFSLSEDVILAIIHTESHFNPVARSHVPAFGLMQIVPGTAGKDATRKLFKRSRLLSPNYLYNPKKNIEVGSAYLNVLYYDYLNDIKNPESRLYYTIAAYNAGASNVAQAFAGKPSFQDAIETINAMTPQQVLERLVQQAPHRETREYVKKVLKRRNYYAKL